MGQLERDVEDAAAKLVADIAQGGGGTLDYSAESLELVEELLAEASRHAAGMSEAERQSIVWAFGSYILAVGRRLFGGAYLWRPELGSPLLMVGDLDEHVAIATFRKVDGRLDGDEANNIPFFFDGFASRARNPLAGHKVLCI